MATYLGSYTDEDVMALLKVIHKHAERGAHQLDWQAIGEQSQLGRDARRLWRAVAYPGKTLGDNDDSEF